MRGPFVTNAVFKEAVLTEVIKFINSQIAEETNRPLISVGVALEIGSRSTNGSPAVTSDPFATSSDDHSHTNSAGEGFTFEARRVSLLELLDAVCAQFPVEYEVDAAGDIILKPRAK
jgi:hypothetical protein